LTIQFKIFSGKKAGLLWEARRFPVRIGRAPTADLQLEDDGVWDNHFQLDFLPAQGIILRAQPEAWVQVNGERLDQAVLRNGDTIELGSIRLQFWLGQTRQAGLGLKEGFSWSLIVAISLAQVALIYWLLR
jgi:pSer/pThr/pTyr-binding forkhead associated (FHA) protein